MNGTVKSSWAEQGIVQALFLVGSSYDQDLQSHKPGIRAVCRWSLQCRFTGRSNLLMACYLYKDRVNNSSSG